MAEADGRPGLAPDDKQDSGRHRALVSQWMSDHWPAMVAAARRYAGNGDEAEDIAQEAVFAAWSRRHRLQDPLKVRGSSLSFVRHKGLHAVRARQRRGRVVAVEQMDETRFRSWLGLMSSDTRRDKILATLDGLPKTQREIVHLILDDATDAEIAKQMGIKIGTVWVYKHRAIKALRKTYWGGRLHEHLESCPFPGVGPFRSPNQNSPNRLAGPNRASPTRWARIRRRPHTLLHPPSDGRSSNPPSFAGETTYNVIGMTIVRLKPIRTQVPGPPGRSTGYATLPPHPKPICPRLSALQCSNPCPLHA